MSMFISNSSNKYRADKIIIIKYKPPSLIIKADQTEKLTFTIKY